MIPLELNDVREYVEKNISVFHQKRVDSLNRLNLNKILSRKNPYLFKAKHILSAGDLIKSFTDAHISSNEEAIFGDWLEGLAIFINSKVYGGRKSTTKGIDLEFDLEGIRYIVTIKSGPYWGNSGQKSQMKSDFKQAIKVLHTSGSGLHIIAVNGCCYGKTNSDFGDYYLYCGQKFWEFISGSSNLYLEIIEPLGEKAKERNEEFLISYNAMINLLTASFIEKYCDEKGSINWQKIVEFNSKIQVKKAKTVKTPGIKKPTKKL